MIALGGAVGTGLIIGSGTALRRGGPLGLLLGYSFVGCVVYQFEMFEQHLRSLFAISFVCFMVMTSLGEMAAYLPHKK
jgi:amino acid transporter